MVKSSKLGRIDYSEALKLSLDADCLVVLRSSNLNTNKSSVDPNFLGIDDVW